MAGTQIQVNAKDLQQLARMLNLASLMSFSDLMKSIGASMEGATKTRFEKTEDPDGKQWKDWSPKYAKRARRDSRRSVLMGPTARLQESISFEVDVDAVYVGSTMIYARVHQLGYKKRNIPARPYLGVGDEDVSIISEDLQKFLAKESGGLL